MGKSEKTILFPRMAKYLEKDFLVFLGECPPDDKIIGPHFLLNK
jgi:hypothetical protein